MREEPRASVEGERPRGFWGEGAVFALVREGKASRTCLGVPGGCGFVSKEG